VPQIEVTFAIDSNGIVNVSARDVATDQTQGIQINPAGGLTKEEIERLVQEANEHHQADAQRRELRRMRNRVEGLIYTSERVFEQFRTMLPEGDGKRIHEMLLRARMALFNESKQELEAAMFDLNAISAQLSEVMLNRAQEPGEGAKAGS
jgi:molecular chaperone DnaK